MSIAKHISGEWEWKEGSSYITRYWNGKQVTIASVLHPEWHENRHAASEEASANAERIVACVNCLAGVPTKELLKRTQKRRGLTPAKP